MPAQEFERLSFSKNWNNKLLCQFFTSIRPVSKKYKSDKVFDIRIGDTHFCYAKVVKSIDISLEGVINFGLNLTDNGLPEKEFIEMMDKMYSKTPWWNGRASIMQVVYFEKVVQLNIFEDGLYPVPSVSKK